MINSSRLIWMALVLILLLPTAVGRLLLDLAGGLIIVLFGTSLLFAGLGWLGWRVLKSKAVTCPNCGTLTFSGSDRCLVCGSKLNINHEQMNSFENSDSSIPASDTTIDVTAEDISSES